MKLAMISVENGITTIGFRKMAAVARALEPTTGVYYIPLALPTPLRHLMGRQEAMGEGLAAADLQRIGAHFADHQMVCFSAMTSYAPLTKAVMRAIRAANPGVYMVWGGIHPIVYPEDALESPADALCIGEGETAFPQFLTAWREGRDYTDTGNFWFKQADAVIRNGFLPLHTSEEMDTFPLPLYADDEWIYRRGDGFVPLDEQGYIDYQGLLYYTVWSIGCPYHCTYCSNSKFIANDPHYKKLRHPSLDTLIREVKEVLRRHPHISTIIFNDDSFMAIRTPTLEAFAQRWWREVGVPFAVLGIIPSFVRREKMTLLVAAGMNRVRMGIQSGSDRILDFYRRPNQPGLIERAAGDLADFADCIVPPAYDIIVDNPIETREDVLATLDLLYRLPRPYTLFVYSLTVMPNTAVAHDLAALGVDDYRDGTGNTFTRVAPTAANITVYLLAVMRPPAWLYQWARRRAQPATTSQPLYPVLYFLVRGAWLFRVILDRMRCMDFSGAQGRWVWWIWRLGFIRRYVTRWRRRCATLAPKEVQPGQPRPKRESGHA